MERQTDRHYSLIKNIIKKTRTHLNVTSKTEKFLGLIDQKEDGNVGYLACTVPGHK